MSWAYSGFQKKARSKGWTKVPPRGPRTKPNRESSRRSPAEAETILTFCMKEIIFVLCNTRNIAFKAL